MRAVAYIRVSTDKKEQELSLEHQHDFFQRYVANRGDDLIKIYSDKGKSATKMKNRKELNAMLKAAEQKKFDKLYVKDISRLFRNYLDFITVSRRLQDLGIQLHLLNMGEGKDIDPFTLNLMAMIAENESQKTSERVKFGKKFGKEKGIVPNFVYGYDRIDKYTLVPNPVESEWVKKIFDLYTEERWGQSKIAQYLFENRVVTKKKKDGQPNYNWSQVSVNHILNNKIYLGLVINGRESTKNIYTNERIQNPEDEWYIVERPEFRIISDEQYEKAQKIMRENEAKYFSPHCKDGERGSRRSEKHLFSNLIKCGSCGFSYRRYQRKYSENRPEKVWWTCSKRSTYGSERCEADFIRVDEQWLKDNLNLLFNYLIKDKQSFLSLIESKCNTIIGEYIQSTAGLDIDALEEEISELNEQRDRVKTLAIKGLISMEEAETELIPINKELDKLNFALHETDKTRELTDKIKENIKKFISNFEQFQFTDNITNADLKKIIKEIRVVKRGEIYVDFNISDIVDGLNFPINLVGLFEPNPTPDPDKPTKKKGKKSGETEDNKDSTEEITIVAIDTNYNHGTHSCDYPCRFYWAFDFCMV